MAIFNQTSWEWSKDHREVLVKNAEIHGERKLGIGGARRVRPQSPPDGGSLDFSLGSGSPRSEASPPHSPLSPGSISSTLLSGDNGSNQNLSALHGGHSVDFDRSISSSIGSAGFVDSLLGSGAADRPQSPRDALDDPPPRTFLQGVTWGYAVIRAVDSDDPAALRHSLQPSALTTPAATATKMQKKKKTGKEALHGINPNAVVDGDGYGGFKWSVWAHRCSGDSVLHLLLRWRKLNALAGLYAIALEFERRDPARVAAEEADDRYALALEGKSASDSSGSDIRHSEARLQACKSFVLSSPDSLSGLFDLQLRDAQGATASDLCREITGRTLPQFWRHAARQARAKAAADAADIVASLTAQRIEDHAALVSAMKVWIMEDAFFLMWVILNNLMVYCRFLMTYELLHFISVHRQLNFNVFFCLLMCVCSARSRRVSPSGAAHWRKRCRNRHLAEPRPSGRAPRQPPNRRASGSQLQP